MDSLKHTKSLVMEHIKKFETKGKENKEKIILKSQKKQQNNFYKLPSIKQVEAVLDRWAYLQKIIKEEITLNEISKN